MRSMPNSTFPQESWEFVYDLRAAMRSGAVDKVFDLVGRIDVAEARQLGAMAPTLLAYYTGFNPSPETVRLTARVLHPHLMYYDPDMSVNSLVEILSPMLAKKSLPEGTDIPLICATIVGFLMPDGDAEIRLRHDLEPLWARTSEDR